LLIKKLKIRTIIMDTQKIAIEAIVVADKKKAWDYYTQPERITKWNFASDDWQCPTASNDLRVGGKYAARMEAKDGSFGFDFEGIYQQIAEGENFIYTLADGRQVLVKFESLGKETKVSIIFDAETENSIELQKNGWQAILNNYKNYTESN